MNAVLPGRIEFCHARDVARGHVRAYEQDHLTRKRPLITPQLAKLLEQGGSTDPQEARKSADVLGYQSAPIDAMLDDCHAWMQQEALI